MHVTLVGHSYGSLAVGLALRRGLAAGDVVFVGSPGVGVSSVSELGMTGEHVFVGETPSDAVADLGWFGRDPSWPEFGASVLPTGARIVDGERLRAARWHSDYFGEGTSSVHAIAAIAVAEPAGR
jgi:pimeloyl-ACP methyl ester carboxylesterase